jgi:hypothetical protein
MSYIEEQNKQAMLSRLQFRPELLYQEIMDAINEYQIASVHHTAVGKFKGIRDFINTGNSILIKNNTEIICIEKIQQLKDLIKSSYMYNTIAYSSFFDTCFNE